MFPSAWRGEVDVIYRLCNAVYTTRRTTHSVIHKTRERERERRTKTKNKTFYNVQCHVYVWVFLLSYTWSHPISCIPNKHKHTQTHTHTNTHRLHILVWNLWCSYRYARKKRFEFIIRAADNRFFYPLKPFIFQVKLFKFQRNEKKISLLVLNKKRFITYIWNITKK